MECGVFYTRGLTSRSLRVRRTSARTRTRTPDKPRDALLHVMTCRHTAQLLAIVPEEAQLRLLPPDTTRSAFKVRSP